MHSQKYNLPIFQVTNKPIHKNQKEKEKQTMARVPQVTRTLISTKAMILAVNLETKQTEEIEIIVPRKQDDENKILKLAIVPAGYKAVTVLSFTHEEKMYRLTEDEFIRAAETSVLANAPADEPEEAVPAGEPKKEAADTNKKGGNK